MTATAASLIIYYLDNAGNRDQPAPVHRRQQPLQEAEPGTPHRVAGGQAVPGHRRRFLPAPDERHLPGLSWSTIWPTICRSTACPGTLWLTKQERIDKDYALFGEASFDVTPQITLTGGGRLLQVRQYACSASPASAATRLIAATAVLGSRERRRQHPDGRRAMLHRERRAALRPRTDTYGGDRHALAAGRHRAARAPTSATSRTARSCRSGARTTASPIA